MTIRFCVKCGTTIPEGILCTNCAPVEHLKTVTIKHCNRCDRGLHRNRWTKFPDEETFLARSVKELFKNPIVRVTELALRKTSKELEIELTNGKVGMMVFQYELCSYCNRQHGEYFEGILQLRSKLPEVLARARTILEEQFVRLEKRSVYITKIVEEPLGVDLYITTQSIMPQLSAKLAARLGAHITITRKLHTRDNQTQKNLYRLYILAQLPEFVEGNVIQAKEKVLHIKQLRRIIKANDLRKGKAAPFRLQDYTEYLLLKQYSAQALNANEVLHPETYQPVRINNPQVILEPGTQYKVVLTDYGVFVVE